MKIIDDLRRRGIHIRKNLSGKLQFSSATPVPEDARAIIQNNEKAILEELEIEQTKAVREAEEKALQLLRKSRKGTERAVATVETDGAVYLACQRKDGSSWVIGIPEEAYDPWRLAAVIMSAEPDTPCGFLPEEKDRRLIRERKPRRQGAQ